MAKLFLDYDESFRGMAWVGIEGVCLLIGELLGTWGVYRWKRESL
jgi:hypothetical protein